MHHEDLHLLLLPLENDIRFSPVHLCILPWFKFERQKGGWSSLGFAPAHGIQLHAGFATTVALGLDQLKELVSGVALLLGQALVFLEQFIEPGLVRA